LLLLKLFGFTALKHICLALDAGFFLHALALDFFFLAVSLPLPRIFLQLSNQSIFERNHAGLTLPGAIDGRWHTLRRVCGVQTAALVT
jgi:hypothetical protein